MIALAVFIAIIAGWWAWKKANEPIPGVDILDTPRPVAAQVLDAGPAPLAEQDAGETDAVKTEAMADGGEAVDAGAPEETAALPPSVDAGATAPVVAAETFVAVTIESSPTVELQLEGKTLGNTPWSGRLTAGRKVFQLQNKALGISTARAITLKSEPVNERYTFEKGFVTVKAPEGAQVLIDGNRVGSAPIRGEIPVYEGSHRIEVRVGQSKWSEPFNLYPGQRVNFNVELQ